MQEVGYATIHNAVKDHIEKGDDKNVVRTKCVVISKESSVTFQDSVLTDYD